jgi:hypothetical protein
MLEGDFLGGQFVMYDAELDNESTTGRPRCRLLDCQRDLNAAFQRHGGRAALRRVERALRLPM